MFPVKNFISRATVWKGSSFMGASGGGVLMMFCATLTAAAHEDWFRRRGGCHVADVLEGSLRRKTLLCGHVEKRCAFRFRATLVASRQDRLVMYIFLQNQSRDWKARLQLGLSVVFRDGTKWCWRGAKLSPAIGRFRNETSNNHDGALRYL